MNTDSRSTNSFKNIGFGFITQIIQMLLGFVSRTVFIAYLAIEYLGAQGLFANILGLLALAELGVGNALMYSLYKPIAEKNHELLNDLIGLFKKIYFIIGGVVALVGLGLLPFLKDIVKTDNQLLLNDIYIIYLLYLTNSVASYFFSHRYSILVADQRNFLVSKMNIFVIIAQTLLQIIVLVLFQDFVTYLIVQILGTFILNYLVFRKTNKLYPFLKQPTKAVPESIKQQLKVNTFSTALVKFSGAIVNNTSSIIINSFVGLVILGKYSNYLLLVSMLTSLVIQVFQGLTSSVANVNAGEDVGKKIEVFKLMNFLNFVLYGLGALGLALLSNAFITIWIGKEYTLSAAVPILIAVNFYVLGMQNTVWTFKSTMGLFKEGRWFIVFGSFLNLFLSIFLGYQFGLEGILMAPIVSRLLTNAWYEPKIVFEKGLRLKFVEYIKRYCSFLLILILIYFVFEYFTSEPITSLYVFIGVTLLLCLVFLSLTYIIYRKSQEVVYIKQLILGLKARIGSK